MPNVPRIQPAQPPYPEEVAARLSEIMPAGMEPLLLFRTLARDQRLFSRFMAAGLLDRGQLSLRQREIAIHRTTALCGSEYEWGVHAALFAERAELSTEELRATTALSRSPGSWSAAEAAIVALMDELHHTSRIGDPLWTTLREHYEPLQIMELIMLAGFYHCVAFLTNGLELPLEGFAKRFEEASP